MYSEFATVYDKLMGDVDYKARTDFLCSLFCRFGQMPTLLLDLACGTGGFSREFAHRGMSVIGVDISPEMLAEAQEKSLKDGYDILYLCQDAAELDLYGTVDGAICCLDSLNHITDYLKFCEAIARVSLFLERDSLFIFDVNTPYKHEEVLGDNTFIVEYDGVFCCWQNTFLKEKNIAQIGLDFFELQADGSYLRSSEDICERAYTQDEIQGALKSAGLQCIAVFDDMGEEPPTNTSERIIYVTRKVN